MNVVGRFKQWRSICGNSFNDAIPALSVEVRLDAAEYELRCITRDVTRVRLSEPQLHSTLWPGLL
jgi:hypothetical protein